MKLFSLSRTIVLQQSDHHISSESYLLNHIEQQLEWLKMSVYRPNDNELFFQKTDFIRGLNVRTYLRNLRIIVDISSDEIRIQLETEMIFITLFGLCPVVMASTGVLPPTFGLMGIVVFGVGYLIKWIIIDNLKKDLLPLLESLR